MTPSVGVGGDVYTFPQSNTMYMHVITTMHWRGKGETCHIFVSQFIYFIIKRPQIKFFRVYQRSHLQMLNEMIGLKGTNLREIQTVMR